MNSTVKCHNNFFINSDDVDDDDDDDDDGDYGGIAIARTKNATRSYYESLTRVYNAVGSPLSVRWSMDSFSAFSLKLICIVLEITQAILRMLRTSDRYAFHKPTQ
ncbi:hypothetical protein DPMN_095912 [Dreissena polymorpha]|uniref:Uncharacterized protein n=1 Tax=Dreissena polymorpha TaxID=45954 RepID=A0A9D4L8T2_DREPO|nr:hypothetical protein DPMN_095912 [Dreissena polymorpha]